jgi:hypothetical protein
MHSQIHAHYPCACTHTHTHTHTNTHAHTHAHAQGYSRREIILEEFEKQLKEAQEHPDSSVDLEGLLASSD